MRWIPPAFQNILRGCSGVLGADTAGLWRALAQNQNHPLAGGPGGLAELLEQYAQTLAQNMKLTYLNPVALVAPNIGECSPVAPNSGECGPVAPDIGEGGPSGSQHR
jgi:hypothetical protein